MPQFLEQCSSCQLPIYLEEGISGSCDCLEGGLRQLLARRRLASTQSSPIKDPRTRTASQTRAQPQPQALPVLSPEMFLSSGALREMHAAQGMSVQRPRIEAEPRVSASSRLLRDEVQLDGEIDIDALSTELGQDLTDLWRDTVAADIGDGFSLDFVADSLEAPALRVRGPQGDPRGSRFRVDRPPPVPEPFRRETIGGPMREIGSARGMRIFSDSRGMSARDLPGDRAYPSIQEVLDSNMREVTDSNTSRRPPTIPARVANAREEARQMEEHARRPTSFDMLRGPDPFDNDEF